MELLSVPGELLGTGSYGNVFKIYHNDVEYAVKRQKTDSSSLFYAAVREEFCGGFKHCNLITRHSSVWSNYQWCGVYEMGVPLDTYAPHHKVLWDITSGLAFLHARGIVHRDITPGNIVSVGQRYKIIDFGLARPMSLTSRCQTPDMVTLNCRPIEILHGHRTDARCDVWSLGVICLSLNRQHAVFTGGKKNMIRQYSLLSFDYQEKIYSKMLCGLDERFTSFQLCDALGLSYTLDTGVSVPYIKGDHLRTVLGHDVNIDKYSKDGFGYHTNGSSASASSGASSGSGSGSGPSTVSTS